MGNNKEHIPLKERLRTDRVPLARNIGAAEIKGNLSEPLVSVVVPIFNHESYIVECFESIKRDKYRRLELIVIDDGSSDRSYEIAASWISNNKDRFEAVKLSRQTNSGITVTLNRLVNQSEGEFIFPLASDDQVASDGVFQLVEYYNTHFNTPTLLFSNVELIDLAGLPIEKSVAVFPVRNERLLTSSRRALKLDVVTRWGVPFQHQFYPRSLFDVVGGYDKNLKFEDLYFALKNVARGTIAYAPLKSRRYRIRPNLLHTPGLKDSDISPMPSRRAVLQDFNFGYRMLISLLCFGDVQEGKLKQGISRVMISLIRRTLFFIYSKSANP